MFELSWPPLFDDTSPAAAAVPGWAVVTGSPDRLPASLQNGPIHTDLATVAPCPDLVIWPLPQPEEEHG